MKLKSYKIVTTSGMDFENAKSEMRTKVMQMCNQGWKLQGGASVKVRRYEKIVWYDIYQTMVSGEQNLVDYDIIFSSDSFYSLPDAVAKMEILLKKLECSWKLQGGASINLEYIQGVSDCPAYDIYQTVIKYE